MPQPIRLLHRVDPKKYTMEQVEPWIKDVRIRPYDVMLAMYLREKIPGDHVTLGGLFMPNGETGSLREDLFQGKVGVVMKVGHLAFTEDSDHRWQDFKPAIGDWVVINVGDTFSWDLPGGWRIRIVDENMVRAIVPVPDMAW